VGFGERRGKEMVCKFCGEKRDFLFSVYDTETDSHFLVCAMHWNKFYFEELTDQLVQNEELKGL
jgi:hypothetical protein